MRVYVAGAYAARDALREHVVPILVDHGHEVTSGWLRSETSISSGTAGAALALTDEDVDAHVQDDLNDIASADVVLLFTATALFDLDPNLTGNFHTGGRHFESGCAHALQMPIVLVGPPENVFQRSLALKADDMEGALAAIDLAFFRPRFVTGPPPEPS